MTQNEGRGGTPNDMQIGGTHYQSEYQVWDFTEKHSLGHLEACIIKYICRWKKKGNGIMDLEKALHYVDKLIDLHKNKRRMPKGIAEINDIQYFCGVQGLDKAEEYVVAVISRWSCGGHLANCRSAILRMTFRRHCQGKLGS